LEDEMAVMQTACACCGEPKFVENVEAFGERVERGEVIFCEACLELPDAEAEEMILTRENKAELNGRLVIVLGGLED
jgi:hypothetical protein